MAIVPDDVSRETLNPASLPEWRDPDDVSVPQAYGGEWLRSRRSALLIVPSIVTAGHDTNVIVNPAHPDAARLAVSEETPVALDQRVFGG